MINKRRRQDSRFVQLTWKVLGIGIFKRQISSRTRLKGAVVKEWVGGKEEACEKGGSVGKNFKAPGDGGCA